MQCYESSVNLLRGVNSEIKYKPGSQQAIQCRNRSHTGEVWALMISTVKCSGNDVREGNYVRIYIFLFIPASKQGPLSPDKNI